MMWVLHGSHSARHGAERIGEETFAREPTQFRARPIRFLSGGRNVLWRRLLGGKQPARFAMKVRDAMTSEVQLCTPDDTLRDAAEAMAALNCGLLPVTDNERLVGMISDRDIAIRGVAMGRGPDSRIGDVMTAEVMYCFDDQDIEEITENMGDLQVRRLPVLDRDKRLVGIIALGDIARAHSGDGTADALSRISRPGGQHAQA
jgi:CBS domain-containing protein